MNIQEEMDAVLEYVRGHPGCTGTEIAGGTGLSLAQVEDAVWMASVVGFVK